MRSYTFTFWIGYSARESLRVPLPSDDSAMAYGKSSLTDLVTSRRAGTGYVGVGCENEAGATEWLGAWDWSDDQILWMTSPQLLSA
jgi:hypothetical protein